MDDFHGEVERMEGAPACFISFFSSGTYTHIRTSSIHTLTLARRAWTLKREMNMSGVNFDWRFPHCARIYGALYRFLSELLTITNGPDAAAGRRATTTCYDDASATPAIYASHLPIATRCVCYYTITNRITGRCTRTVTWRHNYRNMT